MQSLDPDMRCCPESWLWCHRLRRMRFEGLLMRCSPFAVRTVGSALSYASLSSTVQSVLPAVSAKPCPPLSHEMLRATRAPLEALTWIPNLKICDTRLSVISHWFDPPWIWMPLSSACFTVKPRMFTHDRANIVNPDSLRPTCTP